MRAFFDRRAFDRAARVTDGGRAVIVLGHGVEHVHEFILILGLHVDDARDVAEESDIEEAVVGRSVIAGEAAAVHAKPNGKPLQCHVMDDHVIGALHEGRVNRKERAEALGGEAAGKKRGVFLGDADIEIAVGKFIFENLEFRAAGHGGGDGDDFRVFFSEVRDGAAEQVRACGRGGNIDGAVVDLIGSEAVELAGIVECGLIAAAFSVMM